MRKNDTLIRILCSPYCSYYKPGRNEDLLCRGAVVVERLIQAGRVIPAQRTKKIRPGHDARERVTECVCAACDFREHDCDFAQDRAGTPCGGFLLLAELLEDGVLVREDLVKP